jgi:hypothetical protein
MLLMIIEMKHRRIYSQCIIGGFNIRSFLFFLPPVHKKFSRNLISFVIFVIAFTPSFSLLKRKFYQSPPFDLGGGLQ